MAWMPHSTTFRNVASTVNVAFRQNFLFFLIDVWIGLSITVTLLKSNMQYDGPYSIQKVLFSQEISRDKNGILLGKE